jgi:hypothetical protein
MPPHNGRGDAPEPSGDNIQQRIVLLGPAVLILMHSR